jgi:hypothetical protein
MATVRTLTAYIHTSGYIIWQNRTNSFRSQIKTSYHSHIVPRSARGQRSGLRRQLPLIGVQRLRAAHLVLIPRSRQSGVKRYSKTRISQRNIGLRSTLAVTQNTQKHPYTFNFVAISPAVQKCAGSARSKMWVLRYRQTRPLQSSRLPNLQ